MFEQCKLFRLKFINRPVLRLWQVIFCFEIELIPAAISALLVKNHNAIVKPEFNGTEKAVPKRPVNMFVRQKQ